jgi:bifunctional non-homologous end joining protein LigD
MKPMLADTIDHTKIGPYLTDDAWWLQQKLDGHRVLIRVLDGAVTALGRDGAPKANAIPAAVVRQFARMPAGEWFFDGELVGPTFWLFDLPSVSGHVTVEQPYSFRLDVLEKFFAGWAPDAAVRLLPTARTTVEKAMLWQRVQDAPAEGVMLKRVDAGYRGGPARSPGVIKAKLVKTADVVVKRLGVGGKENCEFVVFDAAGQEVPIGKCSLIGKDPIAERDVIEVKYLYCNNPNEPRLYQPRMLRRRTDKGAHECTIDQLVYTDKRVMETI